MKYFVCRIEGRFGSARDLIAGEEGLSRTLEPRREILAPIRRAFAKPAKRAFAFVQNEPACRLMMSAAGVPGEAHIWG